MVLGAKSLNPSLGSCVTICVWGNIETLSPSNTYFLQLLQEVKKAMETGDFSTHYAIS